VQVANLSNYIVSAAETAASVSQLSATELSGHHHCPDIVISCSPDSDDDDDDDNNHDVSEVEQVSCAFDDLLSQHASATTLDDVISDVTRLRDVVEGDSCRVINRQILAAECRQLVVDCKQLVTSVFYCSISEMTLNANRALHSLSALVRHSQTVNYDVRAPAQQIVSNVRRVVSAYEATVTAAKDAVGSTTAGALELANFIKQASTLARCLQLLLSNIVDVQS